MFQALAIFSMTALMVLPSAAQDTVYFSQGIAKGIVGAMPMPMPPMMRAAMNTQTFQAKPHPIAETTYRTPTQSRVARRPNQSAGHPPMSEPTTVP